MKDKVIALLEPGVCDPESILWFDSIDSTNTRAKQLAADGAPERTFLIADRQTGGRGRLGRSFLSPGGMGVYMSVILRPQCKPAELMHLTCAAAVAMCNAVEEAAGFRPGIKWTNDLVFGSKKLGGILTELSVDAKTGLVEYAVVGVGINCCQTAADFPEELQGMATSVHLVTGQTIDRCRLAAAVIRAFKRMASDFLVCKNAIMNQYQTDCVTIGNEVIVLRGEEKRYGKALEVDSDGGLLVEYTDGTRQVVTSGEVSVRGMYGYI